jgi:uncharacterized protein YecE (DUF72 family)
MKSWIGTSGFQYREWKGMFYPEDLSTAKMLGFYAARFSSTEINYTFRSIPSVKTIDRWNVETPDEFCFSLKAPQRVTHFAKLRNCGPVMTAFLDAVKGMRKKQGPILFQLPPTFKKDAEVLREFLGGLPRRIRAAFEFRHDSWFDDETFGILAEKNAALCIAESEDLATPRVATADFGYLRPRREDYTKRDIAKWADFVRGQSKRWSDAFIYFKHEETCVGPGFAETLKKELKA